mgnify:CR=1 FL=1
MPGTRLGGERVGRTAAGALACHHVAVHEELSAPDTVRLTAAQRAAIADEIAMLDRFGISAGALDSVYASKAMRASYHRTNRKRGRRH